MGLKNKTRTGKLTSDCLLLLHANGYMAWRQNNLASPLLDKATNKVIGFRKMAQGCRNGVPDILALSAPYGTLVGIEIKVGKDRLSKDQVEFRNDMLKKNARYHVVTEISDLMDIIRDDKLRYVQQIDG